MSRAGDTERLVQVLGQTEARVTRALSRVLAQDGCSVDEWRALALLADGRPHAMNEVAAFALVTAPSLTRLVDRLVADNLAYRRSDPQDRRRVLVHITERGRTTYRRTCRRIEHNRDSIVTAADWAGLSQLTELLAPVPARPA